MSSIEHNRRRALLVINSRARRGSVSASTVGDALRRAGFELFMVDATPEHRIDDVIRANAAMCDLAIVGGGDGSLNAAAPAILETGLTLGVIPLGTANDFARTIGIPLDPLQAVDVIARGSTRSIDLGEVNGHVFLNVASIGFSADLARNLTNEAKRRWGVLGYAMAAARILARSQLFTAYLDHDGTTERLKTLQVSVGNGRHYGGGMTVEETATAEDGALDFYSLEVDHWWRLLALLPSLRRGTQGRWDDVRAFRTTELTIRTSRPRPVNADGEIVSETPAHFRIRPHAMKVFAPASATQSSARSKSMTMPS